MACYIGPLSLDGLLRHNRICASVGVARWLPGKGWAGNLNTPAQPVRSERFERARSAKLSNSVDKMGANAMQNTSIVRSDPDWLLDTCLLGLTQTDVRMCSVVLQQEPSINNMLIRGVALEVIIGEILDKAAGYVYNAQPYVGSDVRTFMRDAYRKLQDQLGSSSFTVLKSLPGPSMIPVLIELGAFANLHYLRAIYDRYSFGESEGYNAALVLSFVLLVFYLHLTMR